MYLVNVFSDILIDTDNLLSSYASKLWNELKLIVM
jgi:hypothetical protein